MEEKKLIEEDRKRKNIIKLKELKRKFKEKRSKKKKD